MQATFAEHLEKVLGWDSVYAWNQESFGPAGTLGRSSERDVVLVRDLRAHTLMQPIARANRRYPGKDFGLIVDYNGMLRSLREALAQYALGEDGGVDEIVAPLEEPVAALADAMEVTEAHLPGLGFDAATLIGSTGFTRVQGLKAGVNAVYTDDESKRRDEMAQMLARNPLRMNYEKKYQEIFAANNQDKDRATVEDTFARLIDLVDGLDVIVPPDRWTEKEQTQAEVQTFILDRIYEQLPEPPYTVEDKQHAADLVYRHIWQQSVSERFAPRSAS